MQKAETKGYLFGFGCYFVWGFFPLYFKAIESYAHDVICHRIVWSLLLLLAVVFYKKQIPAFKKLLRSRWDVIYAATSSVLIAFNWLLYIWAVQTGYVLETSLGYYINPLFSVLLGVMLLKESLKSNQKLAVALASFGVAYLTWHYGKLPWIALALAFSFGMYGFIRKLRKWDALLGLTLECALIFPIALYYLYSHHGPALGLNQTSSWIQTALLLGCGATTVLPLYWFSRALEILPLSTVGLMQYLAPTFQFLLAVFVFHEAFNRTHQISFLFIWGALLALSWPVLTSRVKRRVA